jgi:hypothetical protein
MTDLNEKLKLVAFYDGKSLHQKNDGKIFIHNELSFDLAIYHTSYDWQIPVWQKVCKDYYSNALNRNLTNSELKDWMISKERYYKEIEAGKPTQSFEILVTAIQFINNLKKK